MACRVGMSMYPYSRMAHWKSKEGYKHGEILESCLTYDQAQMTEAACAAALACKQGSGGDPGDHRDEPVWSVYHVYD